MSQKDLQELTEKISDLLGVIESRLSSAPPPKPAPLTHPSLEKFDVSEAIADGIIEHFENEKACAFEPNARPCDHCSMCSSRGF